MKTKTIGDIAQFAIAFTFFDNTRETELSMFIEGKNILAFERGNQPLTTRWELDELANWLRYFIDHMEEDPYPVDTDGEYAAQKDINARDFDSDNDDEFDAYYDILDDWNLRHRWHTASSGAILADVYFQLVGDNVEISWNNTDAEEGVHFCCQLGGAKVNKNLFCTTADKFLKEYAQHWFN